MSSRPVRPESRPLASSPPEQGSSRLPSEDPFDPAAEKPFRTAPERTPIEPSLLPEEDEYFSFEI